MLLRLFVGLFVCVISKSFWCLVGCGGSSSFSVDLWCDEVECFLFFVFDFVESCIERRRLS